VALGPATLVVDWKVQQGVEGGPTHVDRSHAGGGGDLHGSARSPEQRVRHAPDAVNHVRLARTPVSTEKVQNLRQGGSLLSHPEPVGHFPQIPCPVSDRVVKRSLLREAIELAQPVLQA
jgi:hypothetical protein